MATTARQMHTDAQPYSYAFALNISVIIKPRYDIEKTIPYKQHASRKEDSNVVLLSANYIHQSMNVR